jgi:hypothetical protein
MDNQAKPTRQYIATEFRQFMIAGQTFQQHGSARTGFFNDVIKEAQKVCFSQNSGQRLAMLYVIDTADRRPLWPNGKGGRRSS